MKRCTKCLQDKPLEAFSKSSRTKDGKRCVCKACSNAAYKIYHKNNPDKAAKRNTRWQNGNREKANAKASRYRRNHPEIVLERTRKWRRENPDKVLAGKRAWEAANPEKDRAWKQIAAERRRASKMGCAINDLTPAQWREIKAHYGYRCVYCNKKTIALTQDHIIPLSKGGNHTASNIVPACKPCNSKKHNGPPLRPVQPLLFTIAPPKAASEKRLLKKKAKPSSE